jgi:dienelactone hydrolase
MTAPAVGTASAFARKARRRPAARCLARLLGLLAILAGPAPPATAGPAATEATAAQEMVGVMGADGVMLRTRVLRPQGAGPFPLAIVSHGSPASPARRPSMEVPTFPDVSSWLVQRGYMVALPLRRGYGQTGGAWRESYGSCSDPDYYRAGLATAEDIEAAAGFFRARAEVARERVLLVGYSAGGWGSLALASRNPPGLTAVLNFAGGRGGGHPRVGNCTPQRLVAAAARYGATARIPSLWLYAANDSFFGPELSRRMFDAFVGAGGRAEYVALPAFGSDGHRLLAAAGGRALWQPPAEKFLAALTP